MFSKLVETNNYLTNNYSYSTSWRNIAGGVEQSFSDGSILIYMGTNNPAYTSQYYEYGTAIAATKTLDIYGQGKETTTGALNYNYQWANGALSYQFAGGRIDSYRLDANSSADLGKAYLSLTGNINYSSSSAISGKISKFSQGGTQFLQYGEITGDFNASGNAQAPSSSLVSGTLNGWNNTYYDGSYDRYTGTASIGPNTNIAKPTMDIPEFWSADDIVNIELAGGISSSQSINTWGGNDQITLTGGQSSITIDGGIGDDTITLINSGANVFAGSGNDRFIDKSGSSSVVFSGKYSDYNIVFDKYNNSLTVADQRVAGDGVDTLSNVKSIRFADASKLFTDFTASVATTSNTPNNSIFYSSPSSNGGLLEATKYSGPVTFIQYEARGTAGNDVVTAGSTNDFINLLGGDDAANGGAGRDVLDGGIGSSFLTGGSDADTFFADGRNAASTWSTITDFHASEGDTLNIWGWQQGISQLIRTDPNGGAAGYTGMTYHYDLNGNGAIDTSVTFTGLASNDLSSPTANSVSGNGYLLFG